MNRRQFLTMTLATAGAASLAIVTRASSALAYRPLTNYGDGDGGGDSKSKGKDKRRKRRDNGR